MRFYVVFCVFVLMNVFGSSQANTNISPTMLANLCSRTDAAMIYHCPSEGYVTICERNVEMIARHTSDATEDQLVVVNLSIIATHIYYADTSCCRVPVTATFTKNCSDGEKWFPANHHFPSVNISTESHVPSVLRDGEARAAFLEHNNTHSKRIMKAWYEHGLTGVLQELASSSSDGPAWLTRVAGSVLAVVRWSSALHGSLFPHLSMSNEELIAEFSTGSHWQEGYVRCFHWHPHTTKYALGLRDDSVRVYRARKGDIVPTLKHKKQKSIAALAWQPCSASILAVGCQSCVLLWQVEPLSLATRPSSSSVKVLTASGHSPVTSLAWEPKGAYLASACPTDTAIRIWDVATEVCVPLRRVGGGGISLLSWSPEGTKLFSASPGAIFRVWETEKWSCEKWTKLSNRCQAAVWNPDGKVLLFATCDEPIIYSVTFKEPQPDATDPLIGGSRVAIPVADTSAVDMATDDGVTNVGGPVQNMCWDKHGERLAVSFKDSCLVALFQTRLLPMLELIPCGFVRGCANETADIISFQPSFKDGALLTVIWSSGRVGYVPLYFVPRDKIHCSQLYDSSSNALPGGALYSDRS